MQNKNFIPRWNLESIYKSLECDEYKSDLKRTDDLILQIQNLIDNFKSGDDFNVFLAEYLKKDNELQFLLKTLHAYAYIIYSTDTVNQSYMNNLNLMDDYSAKTVKIFLNFSEVLYQNRQKLPEFFEKNPQLKEYDFLLQEILQDREHQMSVAEEELAVKMSHTGGSAWSLLQEQIISNLHDENGRTFNEIRNAANDSDPQVRKSAWEKEISLLEQNKIAFAACLNNLKGETITLNKKRKWNSALDRALASSRLSKKSLDALISAIEDSLPSWRRYFQAKAKLLRAAGATASETAGTAEHPGIAFYDLFAPIENPKKNTEENTTSLISRNWTFEEAKNYVLKEYYSFSSEMGDFAKSVFENHWIDAEIRAGKVGGAYDEDFPKGHQSRVLTNFTGVFSDLITLAHEIGHAYHFSCMKNKDAAFFDYPMTLAESASTFAETIVKQDMLKQSSGFDRIKVMDLDLTDTAQVLVDILSRFYFENSVFEEKENSELNAEDFCRLMQNAQEKSYGDGLNDVCTNVDGKKDFYERHKYMWAVKSHYYITDLDFYNFPYSFGQLFAAGLYQRSLKEGESFAKKYSEILSNTGSMSCEDLCLKAGFDITTKEFWNSGIEMYVKEIEEYCSFVSGLEV